MSSQDNGRDFNFLPFQAIFSFPFVPLPWLCVTSYGLSLLYSVDKEDVALEKLHGRKISFQLCCDSF